ncbi:putative F-box/LRR-repeat protein [Senna tora]|uniref:Putative F-box/LRR-repeat protein n=1 Tax=Senna tora TaxID=362788 RepID=A0A834XJM6_9FABA|nr:putative F-box/LRR-repeat protein [Senna tora]
MSCLPEALWQNIFQYLPLEDAVITSLISKTCLRAWTYVPILEFHFDYKYRDALEILLKSIDDSLLILKQHPHLILDHVERGSRHESSLRMGRDFHALSHAFETQDVMIASPREAEGASKDPVDVGPHSSYLEAPMVRRSNGDPLMADNFVRRVGNEIFYEDLPRIRNFAMPKRTTINHHDPPTVERWKLQKITVNLRKLLKRMSAKWPPLLRRAKGRWSNINLVASMYWEIRVRIN